LRQRLLFKIILLGSFALLHAGEPVLKVYLKTFPPFVFEEKGRLKGFDIDLWEAVARNQKISFKYIQAETFPDVLKSLAAREADMGISGITINRVREEQLDFSHAYFSSGLSILTRSSEEDPVLGILRAFFSPGIKKIFLGMLLFIIICAHLIWFFERGKDAIQDRYIPGIFEGAWWTIVTMSTVGYGDIAPKKWSGRVIAGFVIITGIAFFGIVIAELSSSFAVKSARRAVESIHDLHGKTTATVQGTTSEQALNGRGIQPVLAKDFEMASRMLLENKVDALVFDTPVLKYFLKKQKDEGLAVVGNFDPQPYGIALQAGSPWRETVNRGLLAIQESGEFTTIYRKWFDSQ
jgi:ABC-type amino acid transport substrate-binding protein